MRTRTIDRDALNHIPRARALEAAFGAIHGVQSFSPEEQAAGLVIAARLTAERAGMDPSDLYAVAANILKPRQIAREDHYSEAIRRYMREEW